jgi:hypothetical protein
MNTLTEIKSMSIDMLEEKLSGLCTILGTLTNDYKHVFDSQEEICLIVHSQIDSIVLELESRFQELESRFQ